MKCYLGISPIKSLNIRKLDVDTNDATIVASDMQSGSIAYAKGQKVIGTGKAFAFASYGNQKTNVAIPVPSAINAIEISSLECPVQMLVALSEMKSVDFTTENAIANAVIDGVTYPITAQVTDGNLTLGCSQIMNLEVFFGKDEHV